MKKVNLPQEQARPLSGEHTILTDGDIDYMSLGKGDRISALSDFFKLLSDSTRLKILMSVFDNSLCVLDISKLLDISASCVSHQLKILKSSNMVESKRVGKKVYYSIVNCHVRDIIEMALTHIEEKH